MKMRVVYKNPSNPAESGPTFDNYKDGINYARGIAKYGSVPKEEIVILFEECGNPIALLRFDALNYELSS